MRRKKPVRFATINGGLAEYGGLWDGNTRGRGVGGKVHFGIDIATDRQRLGILMQDRVAATDHIQVNQIDIVVAGSQCLIKAVQVVILKVI